jgi:hypothetical protein
MQKMAAAVYIKFQAALLELFVLAADEYMKI